MPRREYRHVKGKPEPNTTSDVLEVRTDFAQKIGELSAHGVGVYANGAHIPEQLMTSAGALAEGWLTQHPVKCP